MIPLEKIKTNPHYALAGVSGIAATAFGVLASRTRQPRSILGDLRLRSRIPRYGKKAKKVAMPFGSLGKEWSALSMAAATSATLLRKNRHAAAAATLGATFASIAASHIFDAVLPQKTPPPGRRAPTDPHFPSGHALHSTTILAIAAWVLSREGLAHKKAIAASAGMLAFSLGFDRLMHDRHWTSDVVAGWLAAISIAALAAAGYEKANRPGSSPRRSPRSKSRGRSSPASSR